MNVQVTHMIVHTPVQAREIIAEAGRIADDSGQEGERWDRVFEQACQLLGQPWTFAAPSSPVQLPTMAIPGNHGRH